MKTKYPFLVLFSSLTLFGAVHAAQDDWSLNNHFTIYGDYLYMKRTTIDNKHIVFGPRVQSTEHGSSVQGKRKNLGTKRPLDRFDFEPGYRVGLFYHMNCRNSFEVTYSHLSEWEGGAHMLGNSNLYVPFTTIDLNSDYYNASKAREEYTSRLSSASLNWWYHFTPRRVNFFSLSSILGVRYLQLDESFHLAMTKLSNRSTYSIDTENRLLGGQIGGVLQWNPTDHLSFEVLGKVGAFYNDLEQKTHARDYNNTRNIGNFTRSGSQTAFLGEAALSLAYQIGSYFNIHAGYQFIYLAGVSLAPKQFSLNNSPQLRRRLSKNGEAIIHGAFAGINIGF